MAAATSELENASIHSYKLPLAQLLRVTDSRSVPESQRDSVPKPKVASHELPWVIGHEESPTAKRLRQSGH
jgi:hypothetical protein